MAERRVGLGLRLRAGGKGWWHYFTMPNRRDRAVQRQTVESRVAQAGGWTAFERECRAFIEAVPRHEGRPGGFWREVPAGYPVLAAIQPRSITVGSLPDRGSFLCVELFGMHSSGGRGIPFYWLAVPSRELQDVAVLGFTRGRLNHITNWFMRFFETVPPTLTSATRES